MTRMRELISEAEAGHSKYAAKLIDAGYKVDQFELASHMHLLEEAIPLMKALQQWPMSHSYLMSNEEIQLLDKALRLIKSMAVPRALLKLKAPARIKIPGLPQDD
jgi:hypothetical protein